MRSCSLLEEPQAEPIASSRLPEMSHTLHPLTKMVPRPLLSKQQALIRVPLVMKHIASRHRGGHLWTREAELGSIPGTHKGEEAPPSSHANSPSALLLWQTGSSEDDAAGDSEHQALEAICLKALLICRASHSVLGSGVMVQLLLRSQVLSESAGNLPL